MVQHYDDNDSISHYKGLGPQTVIPSLYGTTTESCAVQNLHKLTLAPITCC